MVMNLTHKVQLEKYNSQSRVKMPSSCNQSTFSLPGVSHPFLLVTHHRLKSSLLLFLKQERKDAAILFKLHH
jgi:hypothetical protein